MTVFFFLRREATQEWMWGQIPSQLCVAQADASVTLHPLNGKERRGRRVREKEVGPPQPSLWADQRTPGGWERRGRDGGLSEKMAEIWGPIPSSPIPTQVGPACTCPLTRSPQLLHSLYTHLGDQNGYQL